MTDQQPGVPQPDGGQPAYPPSPVPSGASVPPAPPPPPSGSVPPPPGYYPPAPPAPLNPPRRGGGSIWLGLIIGLGGSLLLYGLYALVRGTIGEQFGQVLDVLVTVWPIGVGLGGIVLAVIPKTTRTGAGMLLSIGIAILVGGGLCVALLAGYSL